jgi:hypothetical protein
MPRTTEWTHRYECDAKGCAETLVFIDRDDAGSRGWRCASVEIHISDPNTTWLAPAPGGSSYVYGCCREHVMSALTDQVGAKLAEISGRD